MLEDKKVQLLLAGGLIAYISLVNNNVLPSSVKNIVNNSYVKIAVLMLIGLRANYDVMTAVLLAVAFVVTLNCANETEGFQNKNLKSNKPVLFARKNYEGKFQIVGAGQNETSHVPEFGEIKSITIPRDDSDWEVKLFGNHNTLLGTFKESTKEINLSSPVIKVIVNRIYG